MSATPTRATIYEDTAITCMARILGDDAAAITQSDISSISLSVFKNASTTASSGPTALTVSDVIFDSYQTDARWTKDSTGYNFRYQIPASVPDTGDATYQCEFKFTPASQPVFFVVFLVDTVEVFTS